MRKELENYIAGMTRAEAHQYWLEEKRRVEEQIFLNRDELREIEARIDETKED